MDDGLPWHDSPVDIAGDEPRAAPPSNDLAGLGWTAHVLILSSFLLVAFNSHAIANWANQLPITTSTAPAVTAARQWHETASHLGLNAIVDFVEREANAFRAMRWDGKPNKPVAE